MVCNMEETISFHEPSQRGIDGQVDSRLRRARKFLGYSKKDVARILDLNQSFLDSIESGSRRVDEMTMQRLSDLYDRSYDWLTHNSQFGDNVEEESYTPFPTELSDNDQREIREFMQVMDSKSKKASVDDKLDKLIMCLGDNDWTESLHQQLETYESSLATGRVELLNAFVKIGIIVILRPLEGVFGTLLRHERIAGLLLSILRSLGEIRQTSATVLSELILYAQNETVPEIEKLWFPLVSDSMLKSRTEKVYELAINFLLPNFLLADLQKKQKWSNRDLCDPINIYQAAIRLGASFDDTVNAFHQLGILSEYDGTKLLKTNVMEIKRTLLEGYDIDDLNGIDVWCLSHQDEGSVLQANPNDLFIIKLKQNCSAGYLWKFDALKEAGFAMLKDWTEISDSREVGFPSVRKLIAKPSHTASGFYEIEESCPWQRIPQQSNKLAFSYQRLQQLKEGLYSSESPQHTDLVSCGMQGGFR